MNATVVCHMVTLSKIFTQHDQLVPRMSSNDDSYERQAEREPLLYTD